MARCKDCLFANFPCNYCERNNSNRSIENTTVIHNNTYVNNETNNYGTTNYNSYGSSNHSPKSYQQGFNDGYRSSNNHSPVSYQQGFNDGYKSRSSNCHYNNNPYTPQKFGIGEYCPDKKPHVTIYLPAQTGQQLYTGFGPYIPQPRYAYDSFGRRYIL